MPHEHPQARIVPLDGSLPRQLTLGCLCAVWLAASAPSCLVESKCYEDADCQPQQICSQRGDCVVFECGADADCEDLEFVCEKHRCERARDCTTCGFMNAEHSCVRGDCRFEGCLDGYFDQDGDLANGCEFHCEPGSFDANGNPDDGCECVPQNGGVELCNDLDDDCDGGIDEDFDLGSDLLHCGACGQGCTAGPRSTPVCTNGTCLYVCEDGWYDNDGEASTGCEAARCVPSSEVCNGQDDDCSCPGDTNGDGVTCGPGDEGVDEGFDKSLVTSCGPYCAVCDFAHGEPNCLDGVCGLEACEDGYLDLDRKEENGCEYRCTPTGDEICDSTDNDCDGLIDEGDVCMCPPDMVAVGTAYCIDRYEASRSDATSTHQGRDSSQALSRPNVLPWMVNPMTRDHLATFEAACAAVGKRLCSRDEWFAACTGPSILPYVYGSTFDREMCNCVDTFCDDYCAEHGLSSCSTASDCGYDYDSYHEMPTGAFAGCTNDYGTFDINGNVWEVVPSRSDSRGFEVRGGAFNCAGASNRVKCEFNANWEELYAGFRCCKSLD